MNSMLIKRVLPLAMILFACTASICSSQGMQPGSPVAVPIVSAKDALNGAEIISLSSATSGAVIHYTLDDSQPTASSPIYNTPFLITSKLTLNAYATLPGAPDSAVIVRKFAPSIPARTLVWSDEFKNTDSAEVQPDPAIWSYETGSNGFGNHELETYCAWNSGKPPCDPAQQNAYVGTDGILHIVARQPSAGTYTSARITTQGLFSFQYGRLEARIKAPEQQGLWPAFWTLGNNIKSVDWPACGEQDIMERVNAALSPDWNEGSIHGPGFTGETGLGTRYLFPAGQTAAGWHTYGIIWKKNSIAYYVDDPDHPYVTYTNPASLAKLPHAKWPFDSGDSAFLILNLAVGGDWPKAPASTTSFPASLLIDYVRIYTN
jgi:beta-glucanase (GH16 family)